MATSGTWAFDPQIAEIFDEAFERAGIDPAGVGTRHIKSAFRSMRFMLNSEWTTIGIRQWMIPLLTQTMSVGLASFVLPIGVMDVLNAVLRRENNDIEMNPMAREEWLTLVNKTTQGRPDRYFVDRTSTPRTCYIWQCGHNTTDVMVYHAFRNTQDVGASMQGTLQIPGHAHEAMCAGLSAKLALKFNAERFTTLQTYYRGADANRIGGVLDLMRQEDRERGDIECAAHFEPRTTRRY